MVEISIKTILSESSSDIIIGYVSENDISKFQNLSNRIHFVHLKNELGNLGIQRTNGDYQQYTEDSFFSIVQLKWPLILRTLDDYPNSNVIYSDADVIWCSDASLEMQRSFEHFSRIQVFVQDQSTSPLVTSLCMGFAAFRNSNETRQIIHTAVQMHAAKLKIEPKSGDDGIITDIYQTQKFKGSIVPLPQSGFPIGNLANLYTRRHLFPGLGFSNFFIFHANYVVGIHRKILLMYLILTTVGKHKKTFSGKERFFFQIELMLRRFKHFFK